MDSRLLSFAETAAPRYTSYPTAPHFSGDVNGEVLKSWLHDIDADAALSIYIHVPYCRQICWYCGCNTYAARRDQPVLEYVDVLLREIQLVADSLKAGRITEIHWGGGTPNILEAPQFAEIVMGLRSVFDLSHMRQHAIEIDPRHLDAAKSEAYAAAGVNRASLGVQDLNPHVQQAMGRIQPLTMVQGAVRLLRDAGIGALNMDLMFGLPRQSVDDLLHSVRLTAEMRPGRIALFGYAHVPWFKKRQRLIDASTLPGASERFEQAEAARAELVSLGYEAIGLDHFALPGDGLTAAARAGTLRRSFQGYVIGEEADALVGLGPSSIATLPQGYAQSFSEVGAWARAVQDGTLPCARGHALVADDRARRRLIEQIMCDFEGDLTLIGGRNTCAGEIAQLQPLCDAGLARIEGERVQVTEAGRPFCRLVAKAFDTYAGVPAARHSRAV